MVATAQEIQWDTLEHLATTPGINENGDARALLGRIINGIYAITDGATPSQSLDLHSPAGREIMQRVETEYLAGRIIERVEALTGEQQDGQRSLGRKRTLDQREQEAALEIAKEIAAGFSAFTNGGRLSTAEDLSSGFLLLKCKGRSGQERQDDAGLIEKIRAGRRTGNPPDESETLAGVIAMRDTLIRSYRESGRLPVSACEYEMSRYKAAIDKALDTILGRVPGQGRY